MATKRTKKDIELARALREAGRRFRDGRPIDTGALSRLIEARSEQRPLMCAKLANLIQATQDDTARGNGRSALEHLRAAIELASGPAERE